MAVSGYHFRIVWATAFLLMVCAPRVSVAQYPEKPIRLMVPTSSPEMVGQRVAAILSNQLTRVLSQPVVLDIRPGAVALDAVSKSEANGYSLMLLSDSTLLDLQRSRWFDPRTEVTPIAFLGALHYVLVVSSEKSQFKDLSSFVAASKRREVDVATFSLWTMVVTEQLARLAAADMRSIPYKGSVSAMAGLLAGQPTSAILPVPTARERVKRGELRGLAVLSHSRLRELEGVPTAREQGVPIIAFDGYGIVAPPRLGRAERSKLEDAIAKTLSRSEVRAEMEKAGLDPYFGSSDAYRAYLAAPPGLGKGGSGPMNLSCVECAKDQCTESCKICCKKP